VRRNIKFSGDHQCNLFAHRYRFYFPINRIKGEKVIRRLTLFSKINQLSPPGGGGQVGAEKDELLMQFKKVEKLPGDKKKLVKEFLDAFLFKDINRNS